MMNAPHEAAVDRPTVENWTKQIEALRWRDMGRVALLVETPEPHRHVERDEVHVVEGGGFSGDHAQKSFYRGEYIPGREVSAVGGEVLGIIGVDPIVVGDNLITEGVDLASLREGDLVECGEVILERSHREHRPCATFRSRTSPEAFAIAARGYRGALFVVRQGGTLRQGDLLRIRRRPDRP